MSESTTLGTRVRRARGEVTQDDLAAKAKITQQYLSDIERDMKVPSVAVLTAIAEALGTSPGQMLDGVT